MLAVDDDEVVGAGLQRLSRNPEHPFVYEVARSCAEAVGMLRTTQPDVILADYLLQDGYGTDLIALARDVPVVVMTGHGSESVAVMAMRAGASDYIMKDDAGGFLALVGTTLDGALARRRSELLERQRAAEHASTLRENHALEQFASLIAKALSVPLQVVDNYCGLLRAHKPLAGDRLSRSYATAAQAGARRAKALVEDVREYSRITTSGTRMAPVDCAKLFADCSNAMLRHLERARIRLEVAELPTVHGSSTSLASLFRRMLMWAVHRTVTTAATAKLRSLPLGSQHEFQFELRYELGESASADGADAIQESASVLEGSDLDRSDFENPDQEGPDVVASGPAAEEVAAIALAAYDSVPQRRLNRPVGEYGLEMGIMTRIIEHHGGVLRLQAASDDTQVLMFSLPGVDASAGSPSTESQSLGTAFRGSGPTAVEGVEDSAS